jgi:signal transduction histidine kinase
MGEQLRVASADSPNRLRPWFRHAAARPRLAGAVGVLLLVAVISSALLGGAMREAARWAVPEAEAGWIPGFDDGLPYRPPESLSSRPLGQWNLSLPDRVQIHHDFERQPGDAAALALLLPVLNGDAALFVNGVRTQPQVLASERYLALRGGRPAIWNIPDHLLRPGSNRLDLIVTGARHRALDAPPVLGPADSVDRLHAAVGRITDAVRARLPALALIAAALALGAAAAVRQPAPWVALSGAAASVGARALATDATVGAALGPFGLVLDQTALSASFICLGCAFVGFMSGPVRESRPWLATGSVLLVLLLTLALIGADRNMEAVEAAGLGLPVLGLIFLAAASRPALRLPSDRPWRTQIVEGVGLGLLAMASTAAVVGGSGLVWGIWAPALDTVYDLGVVALLLGLAGVSALLTGQAIWRWVRDRPRLSRIIRSQQQEIEAAALALRQQERRSAVLEERQRLSRDMHDGIGGQLISLLARVRSRGITSEQLEGELTSGLAELRLMVDTLDASDGAVADALAVLRSRVRTQIEAAGMTLEWSQAEALNGVAGDPTWVLNLNRLIQEAVTNAVRHSGGTHLGVDIRLQDEGRLVVTVQDDGVGFDRDKVRPGRGLSNLTFRAAQMGGRVRIARGEDGRGAVVQAVIAAPRPPTAGEVQSDDEMMPS